jgi:hypothetical protein
MGAIRRDNPQLESFPYPIDVSHSYEFNDQVFGVPVGYLDRFRDRIKNNVPGDNIKKLTASEMNRLFLDLQIAAGELILIPTSCLFEWNGIGQKPAYVVQESKCYAIQPSPPPRSQKTKDDDDDDRFVAYMVMREPLDQYGQRVTVLAGFDRHLRLIVPETPLTLSLDQTRSIPSVPIELDPSLFSSTRKGGGGPGLQSKLTLREFGRRLF